MFSIDSQNIGQNFRPYIIAELSANHGGSIQRAKLSILAAKNAGVNAIKIQSYTPETMTIDCDKENFKIKEGLWKGYNLYQLYTESFTPFEWHKELFNFAYNIGITIFSSAFDETAVDLLETLNVPAYKIASFELTDIDLIKYIAKKNKPMLISTGMGSIDEINDAVNAVKSYGNDKILLLHCISSYPAATESSHLNNIKILADQFNVLVGLSDHTLNNLAATLSIALGAVVIEKHFKLDDDECGADSSFSLLPTELSNLVNDCNNAWLALGKNKFERDDLELINKQFRRSLYFVKDCKVGHIIEEEDIKKIRPGFGLSPKLYRNILGKKLSTDVERGDPVTWENIIE